MSPNASAVRSHVASLSTTPAPTTYPSAAIDLANSATRYLVPLGRALLAAIFVMSGFTHFSQASIGYAAAQGVPLASLLVPASGILALLGGLSVALGYRAKLGAALLVLFLVPVTFTMHKFWGVGDPMMAQMHMVMFLKNLGLIGGALLIAHFGAGPFSLDTRRDRNN